MRTMEWAYNKLPKTEDGRLRLMSETQVRKAKAFHESFPQYKATPLVGLGEMAKLLGVGGIYVKDESYRFGLNAFKVLGASYAMARYIAKETGRDVADLPFRVLTGERMREKFGQATFFTATDGNHGRGVAWAANQLKQKAVVFMPKGSTQTRLENILKENATATIEDANYDECVRMAADAAAATPRGVVVQDTAWEGYEEIPAWIMQGYGTMALEASKQLFDREVRCPTHIFIQAGVGSLAGAVQGFFANIHPKHPPKVVVVEADMAACLYKSCKVGDGSMYHVVGDMQTIMAGLACGRPNTISWDILRNHVDTFLCAPDWVAAKGMRMLAAPRKGDAPITSGESGAVGFGAFAVIMTMDAYRPLREHLGLGADSQVLFFSTEGDTDPERYKAIVWDALDF